MAFVFPRGHFVVAAVLSMAGASISAQATQSNAPAASPVRINSTGTVSIKAVSVPVQALLEALEPVCPIQVRLDAGAAARPVSIEIDDVAPALAVGQVLKASELDFAMHTTCGTVEKPALVIVRLAGNGRIVELGPKIDPDNPRVKRALSDAAPPLPAGPPPEPERKDDQDKSGLPGGVVAGASETHELAPGEVTGAQMVELLGQRPANAAPSPVIELPFTDERGQPYLQIRPPKSRTIILPFPDANGNLVEVPAPTGPRAKSANFPVMNPVDPNKSGDKPPENVPEPPKSPDNRRPGGGGSER